MTTVLPGARSAWDIIGQQTGQNLNQVLPGAVQSGYERGQIQSGLSQFGKQNPDLKYLMDAIAPFAGTRQGAQMLETILPELRQATQSQQQGNPQTGTAIENIQNMLGNNRYGLPELGQKPQANAFNANLPAVNENLREREPDLNKLSQGLKKALGEQYFPQPRKAENVAPGETQKPQRLSAPPKPIGAKEKQRMRHELDKQGVKRKEVQDQIINDIINEQKETYQAEKEGFKNLEDYQKAKQAEDDRFFAANLPSVKEQFPGMGPKEEAVWKGIAGTNRDIGTDEARLIDANQRYNQLVEGPLSSFVDTGPELPHFSTLRPDAVSDAVADSRSLIQDHLNSIDRIPVSEQFPEALKGEIKNLLRDKYRTAMAEKDFGVAQSAYAISNLSDKVKSSMNKMPKFPDIYDNPDVSFKGLDKMKEVASDKLTDVLMKLDPEDSLILARDYAISQGYPDEIFNRAFRGAMAKGLQLSPFQRGERPELSIPQRMDMNSVLRGKRSVYDLFKSKK